MLPERGGLVSGASAKDDPPIVDMWLPTPKWHPGRVDPCTGLQAEPRFIVIHVQESTSPATWARHALKARASATILINRDGSIWRCVPEEHGPWTNGDHRQPSLANHRARTLGGDPNNWCLTIATEGFTYAPNGEDWPTTPTATQLRSVIWQVRTWMDRYAIPVEHVLCEEHRDREPDAPGHQDVGSAADLAAPDGDPGNSYLQRIRAALRAGIVPSPRSEIPAIEGVLQPQSTRNLPASRTWSRVGIEPASIVPEPGSG